MPRLPAIFALLLSIPVCHAQVYKWTDSSGNPHYSQTPPASGTPYEKISTAAPKTPAVASSSAAPASTRPPPSKAPEAAHTPTTPQQLDSNDSHALLCAMLKNNIQTLKKNSAPVVLNDNGKQRVMEDDERERSLAEQSQRFTKECPQ